MKLHRLILVLGLTTILTGCIHTSLAPTSTTAPETTPLVQPTPTPPPTTQTSGDIDQDLSQSDQDMNQFESDTELQFNNADLGL